MTWSRRSSCGVLIQHRALGGGLDHLGVPGQIPSFNSGLLTDPLGLAGGQGGIVHLNFDPAVWNVDGDNVSSSTRAMAPPWAASGQTWPMAAPRVAPEKRPSVISATEEPKPIPTIADVGLSISRIPGPPLGRS